MASERAPENADDLERLRAVFAGWARGDFTVHPELFADDFVWTPADALETGEYRGVEEVRANWRTWLEAWEDFRIEAEEIVSGPDSRYVVMQRFHGVGKSSGVLSEDRTAVVVTMRGGKIARLEGFWDRDAALRAAGVERP